MIRDLHVRQLNHILKVNEDLRASNERMRVVLATLQSEVQTDLVKDLIVVAGKLSELEYDAYVRNRRKADNKYSIKVDDEGRYVVKSLECEDAPPRYFWDKQNRCNCWERIAEERMCCHEKSFMGTLLKNCIRNAISGECM